MVLGGEGFILFVDVVAVHFEISRVSGVTAAVVNMSVPSSLMKQPTIQSTAGAVPVRNEKGTVLSGFPVGSYLFRQDSSKLTPGPPPYPQRSLRPCPYFFDFPVKLGSDRVAAT